MPHDLSELIPFVGMAIPILTIVLGMTVGIIAVVTVHRRKTRELEQRHVERMAAIEKGFDIPVERDVLPPKPVRSALLRGLIWLGVGLALVFDRASYGLATFGGVSVAVGSAYLIVYFVEERQQRSDAAKSDSAKENT